MHLKVCWQEKKGYCLYNYGDGMNSNMHIKYLIKGSTAVLTDLPTSLQFTKKLFKEVPAIINAEKIFQTQPKHLQLKCSSSY